MDNFSWSKLVIKMSCGLDKNKQFKGHIQTHMYLLFYSKLFNIIGRRAFSVVLALESIQFKKSTFYKDEIRPPRKTDEFHCGSRRR